MGVGFEAYNSNYAHIITSGGEGINFEKGLQVSVAGGLPFNYVRKRQGRLTSVPSDFFHGLTFVQSSTWVRHYPGIIHQPPTGPSGTVRLFKYSNNNKEWFSRNGAGLQVFNADGSLHFDSAGSRPKIIHQTTLSPRFAEDVNWSYSLPSGRQIAVSVNGWLGQGEYDFSTRTYAYQGIYHYTSGNSAYIRFLGGSAYMESFDGDQYAIPNYFTWNSGTLHILVADITEALSLL